MKIIIVVFFIYCQNILSICGEIEHVHFKIHVPEIIKHHIHTRVIFIHDNIPPHKETPQSLQSPYDYNVGYQEETHAENWSSWNNQDYQGGHHHNKIQKHLVHPDPEAETGVFLKDGQGEPVMGYNYPPQYMDEVPHNHLEDFMEDSYKHGLNVETGHYNANEQENFYDANQEEADLNEHDYYHDEHDHHAHLGHHKNYDKEIGYEDRTGKDTNKRKYYNLKRKIPR